MTKMAENGDVKRALNAVEQGVKQDGFVVIKTATISDGSTLEVRKLLGKDIMTAQLLCGGNPQGLMLAMTALACRRDGAQVLYEDLQDEDAFIVMDMMQTVMEGKTGNFTYPAVAP